MTDLNHEARLHDERALIGRLMLGTRHINEIITTLPCEAFSDPNHAAVYQLVTRLHIAGLPKDIDRVAACLPHNDDLATTVGSVGLYRMLTAAESCPEPRSLALACAIVERAESASPEPPPMQAVDASPLTHHAVSVPGGILVFPRGDYTPPQCVAPTKSKTRCAQHIYPEGWEHWVIEGMGYVNAADGTSGDPNQFLYQRCEKHLGDATPNVVDPEWEWFTPERFPGLISPHPRVWTRTGLLTLPDRPVVAPAATPSVERAEPEPVAPSQRRPDVPTLLYWHYDADEVLLYIGITDGPVARGKAHAAKSSWVHFARTSKSVWFPNRPEAEAAEKAAIESERPLFNHVHNDSPEARARLVAYLIKHGRTDLLAPAVSRG